MSISPDDFYLRLIEIGHTSILQYSAIWLASMIGMIQIIQIVLTNNENKEKIQKNIKMLTFIYFILSCLMICSFIGIFLVIHNQNMWLDKLSNSTFKEAIVNSKSITLLIQGYSINIIEIIFIIFLNLVIPFIIFSFINEWIPYPNLNTVYIDIKYKIRRIEFKVLLIFLLCNIILFFNNIFRYILNINYFFISTILSFIYIITSIVLIFYSILVIMNKKNKLNIFSKKIYFIIFIILTISIPLISPAVTMTYTNVRIKTLSFHDKINYIVKFVNNENEYITDIKINSIFEYFNIYNIYNGLKVFDRLINFNTYFYYLTGVGKCGEIADASIYYLQANNITCRKVVIPGENHAFFEVYQNGNWRVYDLGYSNMNNITRLERAKERLNRMGSMSYVEGYDLNGYIDLTKFYVNTDLIDIKIENSLNEPLKGIEVVLKHQFRGNIFTIPDHNSFVTDTNGEVTLNLGKMSYNSNAQPAEDYYWIFVNGVNSTKTVTSYGNGDINNINIIYPITK